MAKTALIVWEHGGNLGHLSRLLPIAVALQAEKWEVVFAVADEVATKRYLNSMTFRCVKIPRIATRAAAYTSGPLNHAEMLLRTGFEDLPAARANVTQWLDLFDAIKPEALLIDASSLALYAARSAGWPAIAIGHGYEIPPEQEPRPCFMPWMENSAVKAADLEVRLQKSLMALATSLQPTYRAKAPTSMNELFRSDCTALCAWPELDHFDRTVNADSTAATYTGPIWSEPPGGQALGWPDGEGPKVLCYLNLRDKRYDLVWQALKLQQANVLVISPSDVPRACESARGWGIHVVEQPVQLGPLVEECDAVVGHGGMGLTSMALHSGRPILLLPEHMEQAILAYRLSKRGLALGTIRLNGKTAVATKIEQLLGDEKLKQQSNNFSVLHGDFHPNTAVQMILTKLTETG